MLCCHLGILEGFTTEFFPGIAGSSFHCLSGLAGLTEASEVPVMLPIGLDMLQREIRTSIPWKNTLSLLKITQLQKDPRVTLNTF